MTMEFTCYTLPNGIRCIHKQVRSAVVNCALTVNTGSLDEEMSNRGSPTCSNMRFSKERPTARRSI